MRLTYANAKEFIGYLREMMDGDLIEVKQKECGCLESIKDDK